VANSKNVVLAEILKEAGFATAGFVAAYPLDRQFGFDQGFDHFDDRYDLAKKEGVRDQEQRRAEAVTDAVLEWLDRRPAGEDERLFLFVHYFDPHWPYDAPPPFGGMYRRDSKAWSGSMGWLQQAQNLLINPLTREEGMKLARALDAEYCAEISYCDYHLGRLLAGLRNRNLYDSSLIVLTADHGETMHEHANVFNHGCSVYDTEIHIPLILRFPQGQFAGRREDRLGSNVDVVPTILHLLDLPDHPRLEGQSFAGLIDGLLPPRDPVFAEATQPWLPRRYSNDPVWINQTKFQGLRTERYKYVSRLADSQRGLYDLQADPAEQVNLLLQGGHDPALAEAFRTQLEQWRAQADPLPSREIDTPDVIKRLGDLGYIYEDDDGT
jgi:arylsulfatase A-like enzyme